MKIKLSAPLRLLLMVWFYIPSLLAIAADPSATNVPAMSPLNPDWRYYHEWITKGEFDKFSQVNPVAYSQKFQPMLTNATLATNDQFLLTLGSGIANSTYWYKLDDAEKTQLYQQALPPLKQAADSTNMLAMQDYAWMLRVGMGCKPDTNNAALYTSRLYDLVIRNTNINDAVVLDSLATFLQDQGDFDTAKPLYERALAIREQVLVTNHLDIASSLDHLANLLNAQADYAAAKPLYERALAIREQVLGPEQPATATSLNNLAGLLKDQGDYLAARQFYERSLSIYEKALGSNHLATAAVMCNLAGLLQDQGDYTAAKRFYERAIVIIEKLRGSDHPDTAACLNNLAELLREQGDYAAAKSPNERAVAIFEKKLGPGHPYTIASLNNLAVLLWAQGDYAAAKPLYERAVGIMEKTQGSDHPDTATCMGSLAVLLTDQGDYADAKPLYEHALAIFEKTLGPEHPATATCLFNLACLLRDQGNYDSAKPLFERALSIRKKVLGLGHPDTALCLITLVSLSQDQGDFTVMERLYSCALNIVENALGPDNPAAAGCLSTFVRLLISHRTELSRAHTMLSRSIAINDKQIENVFSISTERQRLKFMATLVEECPLAFSLAECDNTDASVQLAIGLLLKRKGLVLDSLLEDRQKLLGDPEAQALDAQLKEAKGTIAGLVVAAGKDSTDASREARQKRIAELEVQAQEIESKLVKKTGRYAEGRRAGRVTVDAVRQVLEPDEKLIEFVRYAPIASAEERKAWIAEKKYDKQHRPVYAAAVLDSGTNALRMVTLDPASEIDEAIGQYQDAMRAGTDASAIGSNLYARVWEPLADQVGSAKRVLISPDGNLNFLAFAALPEPDCKLLVEKHEVGYVTSGRDLVRRPGEKSTNGPSLFGDPAFGSESHAADYLDRSLAFRSVLVPSDRSAMAGLSFSQLPGTRKEVEALAAEFGGVGMDTRVYLGADATEGRLKAENKPAILHLATHGFFLPDVTTNTPGVNRLAGFMSDDGRPAPMGKLENPMHRSGLALTGAGLALAREGKTDGDKDDGIVTAEEVGSLDLWGTDLVVLSACDTAVGKASAGEGVMGLRRAFVQAGTKNLMMTLWPVQDEATSALMQEFYKEFLISHDAVEAISKVQRNAISEARKTVGSLSPRAWAPFLVSVQGSTAWRRGE